MLSIQSSLLCCLLLAISGLAAPPSNQTVKPGAEKRARKVIRLRPSNFTRPVPSNITLPVPSNFALNPPSNNTAELGCGVSIYSGRSFNENSGDEEDLDYPLEVIGGQEALAGQYPWLVKQIRNGRPMCGGVIIDPYYILTAAHCLHSCQSGITIGEKELSIRVGAHEYNSSSDHGQSHEVEKTFVHENYCAETWRDDIGMLKLRRPIRFVLTKDGYGSANAICMPQADTQYEDGEMFNLAGWGITNFYKDTLPKNLQKVRVPHVEDDKCARNFAKLVEIGVRRYNLNFQPETELCAGGKENEGSCKGDSGGPLMKATSDGHELVGLVSRAYPCSTKGNPTVYTQVDSYLDWIQQIMDAS